MVETYTGGKNPNYRPRVSIDLTTEQRDRIDRLVPWGLVGHLFRKAIDDTLDLVEKLGAEAFVVILRDLLPNKSYLSIAKEAEKHGYIGGPEEKHPGVDRQGVGGPAERGKDQPSDST